MIGQDAEVILLLARRILCKGMQFGFDSGTPGLIGMRS